MGATPIDIDGLYPGNVEQPQVTPMNSSGQRSTAVIASGVIAILGSLFAAIGVLFSLLGIFIASRLPNTARFPDNVRVIVGGMMAVFLGIAIWGIFSGVGLIRFRNWARISVLVWAGITTPICLMAMAVMIFIPLPPTPNSAPIAGEFVRAMVVIFYGAPLAIAVWWLILFTRPRVVEQFQAAPVSEDAQGDPFTVLPPPAAAALDAPFHPGPYANRVSPSRPGIPLPIIVLACFFLISAASIFFIFFFHMPAMVFGHAFTGLTGSVVYATWCALYAVAGVGMLRRVSWAYSVAIGVQILGIVSGIMTVLSPNFDAMMRRAISNMRLPPPEVYAAPSMEHLRGFSVIGLLFPLTILGLLAYYRPRFLEACAATAKGASNPATPGNSPTQSPAQRVEPVG